MRTKAERFIVLESVSCGGERFVTSWSEKESRATVFVPGVSSDVQMRPNVLERRKMIWPVF